MNKEMFEEVLEPEDMRFFKSKAQPIDVVKIAMAVHSIKF